MSEYPIEGLMNTAMGSIKEMVDVNTIVGDPIQTSNNVVIIPISKVNFGFAAGGTEFNGKTKDQVKKEQEQSKERLPFGGGSGAGVSISPIAFIVVQANGVKLLPVEHSSSLDKLLDLVPDLADKLSEMLGKTMDGIKLNKLQKEAMKDGKNSEVKITTTPTGTTTEVKQKPRVEPDYDIEYDETDM